MRWGVAVPSDELQKTEGRAVLRGKIWHPIMDMLGLTFLIRETFGVKIQFGSHQHTGCL